MINQFENINSYNSFFDTLKQLETKQSCCKKCYLISPSDQRFHLSALISFAKTGKYLTSDTIQLFTKLNDAGKQRSFTTTSKNCFQWIYHLLLRLGDALARLVGLGYKDFQDEINQLTPNRNEAPTVTPPPPAPVPSSTPVPSPTVAQPSIPVLTDPTPTTAQENETPVTPAPLPPASPSTLPSVPVLADPTPTKPSDQSDDALYRSCFQRYQAGQLDEEQIFWFYKTIVGYYREEQSLPILVDNIDCILNMNHTSELIKWFPTQPETFLLPLTLELLNSMTSTQFLQYYRIVFYDEATDQYFNWSLFGKVLDKFLVRYPNNEEILHHLLNYSIRYRLDVHTKIILKQLSQEQLANFVRKWCQKDTKELKTLIQIIPIRDLKEKLPIIISALNRPGQEPVTVDSLINEQLDKSLPNTVTDTTKFCFIHLCAYKDIILLGSDLSETEKCAALLQRFVQIINTDKPHNMVLISSWLALVADGCDAKDLRILINFCRENVKDFLFSSYILFLKFIVVESGDLLKIETAFIEIWSLLRGMSDYNYRVFIVSEIFVKIPNAASLGAVLKAFPDDGEQKWLVDLFQSVVTGKISKNEKADLLIASLDIYPHIDDEFLGHIFCGLFDEEVSLMARVKQAVINYQNGLVGSILTASGMPDVQCNVVKNYLVKA